MNWTIAVLIICCLIGTFTIWKELYRRNRSFIVLRIAASVIAVASLAFITLPISYTKKATIHNSDAALLLTAGYDTDSLNKYNTNQLFTTDQAIEKEYPRAKLISLSSLSANNPPMSQCHVLGYGLTQAELNQLDHLPLIFNSSSIPQGVNAIYWSSKLAMGEILKVQGKYKNNKSTPVKLILNGLNTTLDTLTIAAKTYTDFELNAIPKNEGRAVYHLLAISANDTLEYEQIPVEIIRSKPLNVLMLTASPDFETKFLKNWLSEKGYAITIRSAISKGKYSNEYVNMASLKTDHLNTALLNKFDLVIGDVSSLKSESAVLKQEVEQNGLGIIIYADTLTKASGWLQNDFPVEKIALKNSLPVSLIIKGKKGKLTALKTNPGYIKYRAGTQSLVNDVQEHLLVGASLAGAGRLVFTTINNTFNWILRGNKDDYAAYWSLLISKAARKIPSNENWSITPQLPVVNDSVHLQLETTFAPEKVISGNSIIAPEQNQVTPFEWGNTYWPGRLGWHFIKQYGGKQAWWYVYDEHQWQSVKAVEKITATSHYAKNNPSVFVKQQVKKSVPVSKLYFYLTLFIAVTFLWIEAKVSRSV